MKFATVLLSVCLGLSGSIAGSIAAGNPIADRKPLSVSDRLAQNDSKFPDRILSSKTLRGRFVKVLQGDYFYVTVSTTKGEEIFLLNGYEHCFLTKYAKESVKIDYDVVAGGYRQVNIIRNITTRQTTLQKWQRTATKKALKACDKLLV
jgi:hypothetical protein